MFHETLNFRFADDHDLEMACFPFNVADSAETISAMMRICCADRRWLGSRAPRLRSSVSSHRGRYRSVPGRTPASGHRCTRPPRRPARHPSGRNASGGAALARRAVGGVADAGRPPAPRDGRHVPGHHGAEWPRGTRRQGPRLADRASSAGTVCKTIRVRSNCALVCRRYRPASGTSSFTMRTDVAASDPPSDSARSPRRRPIRGARG